MTRYEQSLPPAYFDEIYAGDPDPWRFTTSPYEKAKYAATLAALPRVHYASALEIGCSIGTLTQPLAERCDAVLALDVAEAALTQARARCARLPHVAFANGQVPGSWPDGRFDLVLLSEVVYYLDRGDILRLADRLSRSLAPEGDVVLVHWLGPTHYPLSGDEASEALIAALHDIAVPTRSDRCAEYRLDVLRRRS